MLFAKHYDDAFKFCKVIIETVASEFILSCVLHVCDSIAAYPWKPKLSTAMASWHRLEPSARPHLTHLPCREIRTV